MNQLLLVIDCQKAFVNNNTKECVERIDTLIKSKKYNFVIFTRFINNKDSRFYQQLDYKGCMTEEEQAVAIDTHEYPVFDKKIYTALNDELENYIKENHIDEIHICGFCTDACVQKTAVDLFEKGMEVYVLQDYCMSSTGIEWHNSAMNIIKKLIGRSHVI